MALTTEQWRELVGYDALTGRMWSKKTGRSFLNTGDSAGYIMVSITVEGRTESIRAHALAWRFERGEIPPGLQIDHKDRDRRNNRILNLRLASRAQNAANCGLRSDSVTGFKGVSFSTRKNRVRRYLAALFITVGGKRVHKSLGVYATAVEAAIAYDRAAAEAFGEFAETNLSLGNYDKHQWEKHEQDQQRSYA